MTWFIPIIPVLWALMDGFYDEGKKLSASIFKALVIGAIALSFAPLFDRQWWHIAYFLLCWWVLFDPTYNISRGLPPLYVGKTKWTDKLIQKIFRTNSPHFSFITKLMSLAAIVGMIIKGLKSRDRISK